MTIGEYTFKRYDKNYTKFYGAQFYCKKIFKKILKNFKTNKSFQVWFKSHFGAIIGKKLECSPIYKCLPFAKSNKQ